MADDHLSLDWIVLESLDKGSLCFVIVKPTKYRDLLLFLPTTKLDDEILALFFYVKQLFNMCS